MPRDEAERLTGGGLRAHATTRAVWSNWGKRGVPWDIVGPILATKIADPSPNELLPEHDAHLRRQREILGQFPALLAKVDDLTSKMGALQDQLSAALAGPGAVNARIVAWLQTQDSVIARAMVEQMKVHAAQPSPPPRKGRRETS